MPSSGPAQDDGFTERYAALVQAIESIVATQTMGTAVVGIDVVEVASGRRIWGMKPDRPLNPASNVKIVTAYAALSVLRPEYTYDTVLYGDAGTGSVLSRLTIKGYGDPSFATDDLVKMTRELYDRGVRKISGPLVVDDTYFDDVRLPYAFDNYPGSDEDSPFRAPVGAVSINGNTLAITVGPGAWPGAPAKVTAFPPGYPDLKNETMTVADGVTNLRIHLPQVEGRPSVRVWGDIAAVASSRTYDKRIADPALNAGFALKEILAWAGIESGEVLTGKVGASEKILVEHESMPMGALLLRVGKNSDNFYAEQLLKSIGAEAKGKPGTADKGIEAVQEVMASAGIDVTEVTYKNGSGLYDANLLAPSHFTKILTAAWLQPEIRAEFVSQLATGGADGTLSRRYKDPATLRRVRAKTGTLKDTSALSGYVLAPEGTSPVAFSILVNQALGRVAVFRTFQENIATAIAHFLWK
jgi:D-alanyl-D-alanine carboxypeptidase/D-alanyl-D-alanine-endopeptidase (penicillin-binding protein 4)